jgi:hypothetical protein
MSLTQVVTWDENGKLARTKDFLSSPAHWHSLSYLFPAGEKVNDVALDWHSEYITSDFISGSMGAFVVTTTGTSLKIYSVANLQADPTATLRHTYTMGDSSVSGSARIAVSRTVPGFVVIHWCERTKCMVGRSTDGGLNWGAAVQVGNTFTANPLNDNAECGLAIEGQQRLCSGHNGITYQVYRAATATGSFAPLSGSPSNPMPFSSLQVDTQGSLYVAVPNLPGLSGSTDDIGLLTTGGVVYTGNFTTPSPSWSSENWSFGSTLNLLNNGEFIVDGVQKPGSARTLYIATNTKARIFTNILNGTTVGLTYALRATSGSRTVQAERGDPNICYILSQYSDGLWSEGHINGTPITANRIGATTGSGNSHPPVYVDANNPLIAYAIALNGSSKWRLFKTTDGGQSWAESADYAYNTVTAYEWDSPSHAIGPDFFTFGLSMARSYTDPSILYVCTRDLNSPSGTYSEPVLKLTATTSTIISPRYSEWPFPRWIGAYNRHGLATYDGDANVLFLESWRPTGFGNSGHGRYKTLDAGATGFQTLAVEGSPHNVSPSAYFGGDGSVFECHAGVIRFHPDIYALNADSDFTAKTGSGYPASPFTPLNLFGL